MQVPRCFPPASTQFHANIQTPVSSPVLLTQDKGWIWRSKTTKVYSTTPSLYCSKILPDLVRAIVRPLLNCLSGTASHIDMYFEFCLLSGDDHATCVSGRIQKSFTNSWTDAPILSPHLHSKNITKYIILTHIQYKPDMEKFIVTKTDLSYWSSTNLTLHILKTIEEK